ncbi:MAG: FAD-binding oxidoreductase [Proteobacteria bacterium]|nr:FAD-binding oxidoreductase [Pseudomonadota bacterium]
MERVLPPGMSAAAFDKGLVALRGVVGAEWVLDSDEDRDTYLDPYATGNAKAHAPSAAVAPANLEQVQAVMRVANAHRLPLWPISRGKNFGYGGAAPRLPGSLVLDLGRLNRVLEVNEKLGYCVIEPGVTFYDLHEHLTRAGIALEFGVPNFGWGSPVGNALDRGFSFRGDHSSSICGMEVVLPDGSVLRTGNGAMPGSAIWATARHGFGPSWDQAFVQANYGVVTKMGLWLHPVPEQVISVQVALDAQDDLGWFVDEVSPLLMRGVLGGNIAISTATNSVIDSSQRQEWYTGPGALPDSVVTRMMAERGMGWWNGTVRISGHEDTNQANLNRLLSAMGRHTRREFQVSRASGASQAARGPVVTRLKVLNWFGGRGGHVGFSPVMPASGATVLGQFRRTKARYDEHGIDYNGTFYLNGRSVTNVNLMLINLDDADHSARTQRLFDVLVSDASAQGYAEYRTHLDYMDAVAASFDFNDHALRRFNERVKDAIDPNGILAPGRNGIWPSAWRNQRGSE